MKITYLIPVLLIAGLCSVLQAYGGPAGGSSYNFIYVDNSRSFSMSTGQSAVISEDMATLINAKLDSLNADKQAKIEFFAADAGNPNNAKSATEAKGLFNRKLQSGNSGLPKSLSDLHYIRPILMNDNFTGIETINISFFVTEYYLSTDLLKSSGAMLINNLARQLQYVSNLRTANINITIYYPKASKGISPNATAEFNGYINAGKKGGDFGGDTLNINFKPI